MDVFPFLLKGLLKLGGNDSWSQQQVSSLVHKNEIALGWASASWGLRKEEALAQCL